MKVLGRKRGYAFSISSEFGFDPATTLYDFSLFRLLASHATAKPVNRTNSNACAVGVGIVNNFGSVEELIQQQAKRFVAEEM